MFAAEARGEVPKGTALEWAHETPSIKSLPEHVSDKDKKKKEKKAQDEELLMATDIRQKVLEHTKVAHMALDKAKTELDKAAATKAAYEALIPGVVDALINNQRIDSANREKLAAALKDPVRALEILTRTADPEINVKRLGQPEKDANAKQQQPQQRKRAYAEERGAGKTEADLAWEKHFQQA
jgi:hypothetical protein